MTPNSDSLKFCSSTGHCTIDEIAPKLRATSITLIKTMTEITTQQEHEKALGEIEQLMALDPKLDTSEGDRLLALAEAVETYEKKAFPQFFQPGN